MLNTLLLEAVLDQQISSSRSAENETEGTNDGGSSIHQGHSYEIASQNPSGASVGKKDMDKLTQFGEEVATPSSKPTKITKVDMQAALEAKYAKVESKKRRKMQSINDELLELRLEIKRRDKMTIDERAQEIKNVLLWNSRQNHFLDFHDTLFSFLKASQ